MNKVEKVVRKMCLAASLDSQKFPSSFYDKLNDAERAEAVRSFREKNEARVSK